MSGADRAGADGLTPRSAAGLLCALLEPVAEERIPLGEATGRVLAEAVLTDRPSPAADVSAMDGYAVRLDEARRSGTLPVVGEARIGAEPPPLPEGAALRIVTGAAVPPGADTVVRREDTRESETKVEFPASAAQKYQPGANIRREGENAPAGTEVVGAGTVVTPAVAGALASFGCARPRVRKRVRVGVIVTGDEVLPADSIPSRWQLRDSNGPSLRALLGQIAWIEVMEQQRCGDDREELRRVVETALERCDALLLTGGVSMGTRDYVPSVLEEAGSRIVFHRVPQRPGKPVLGAIGPAGQAVLGLPGNPVSVLVTARRMALPALRRLAGFTDEPIPPVVTLPEPDGKRLDLWWHRLVRLTGPGAAALVEGRGSGDIAAAARSDGFIEVPPGQSGPGPWPFYAWTQA